MAQQVTKPFSHQPEKTVVESRVVSAPNARVVETVTVLSKSAAERLETKGEIPAAAVRQLPSLDTVDVATFARQVAARAGASGGRDLLERAEKLAWYAKTGQGLSDPDARMAADAIAEVIGYAPLARASEDGFGIVLLGASGRAKLKQGQDITTKELHTLATLSPMRRAPISGNARGEVARQDAIRYLADRGLSL